MIDSRQLREDLRILMTRAPIDCPQEERCFRVARALLALLPEPVNDDPAPDIDPDEVPDYAPDWSGA